MGRWTSFVLLEAKKSAEVIVVIPNRFSMTDHVVGSEDGEGIMKD